MNPQAVRDLARQINEADGPKGVLYVTGGGTEVLPILLSQGGGSSTLLGARIPYDPADLRDLLGFDPGRLVDARSSRAMAMMAFRHALKIRGNLRSENVFGLGSTSKLATGPGERAGRSHEIHATVQTSTTTTTCSVILPKGNDRAWEERINAILLLNLVAMGKWIKADVAMEHDGRSVPINAVRTTSESGELSMSSLLVGDRRWVALDFPGRDSAWTSEDQSSPRLLLPGSFRPIHAGHLAMAEAASNLLGQSCAFELSLFHPEKPPLDFLAIRARLDGFQAHRGRIYLTNAPTYVEKARLFPGCTFAVGHDTAERIVDPRFYGGETGRNAMLDELVRLEARFLVFGRVDASGTFRDFSAKDFEAAVSGFLERVATPVPGHIFRLDISSTEIRQISGDEFA